MLFSIVGSLAALTCVAAQQAALRVASANKNLNNLPVYFRKTGNDAGVLMVKDVGWQNDDPEYLECNLDNGIISVPSKSVATSWYLSYEGADTLVFYEGKPEIATLYGIENANGRKYLQAQNEGIDQGTGTVFHLSGTSKGYWNVSVWNGDQDHFNVGDYLINITFNSES